MKYTVQISPTDQVIIRELFQAMRFVEVDRVATGGMMSDSCLLITYEGEPKDFSDKVVVEKTYPTTRYYYSINCLVGMLCGSIEEFADKMERLKQQEASISIHRL